MIRSLTVLFVIFASNVSAGTLVTRTKPVLSGWAPTDFQSVEVRFKGRLSTDPATTNKIIGRVLLKGVDVSLLTQRVTIMVPANQTWEIKTMSANFTPVTATGIAAFEIPMIPFAQSYLPPSGQILAVDVDATTGNVVFGPVSPAPVVTPPPTPTPPPVTPPSPPPVAAGPSPVGSCMTQTGLPTTAGTGCLNPLPSLIDSTGGIWIWTTRDSVDTSSALASFGYLPLSYIYIRSTGVLCGFNSNHGDICFTGGKWQ